MKLYVPWRGRLRLSAEAIAEIRRLGREGLNARQIHVTHMSELPSTTIDKYLRVEESRAKPTWAASEIELLIKMELEGRSDEELVMALPGRTHNAIQQRLSMLRGEGRLPAVRDKARTAVADVAKAAPEGFKTSRYAGLFLDRRELTMRKRSALGVCVNDVYFDDPPPGRRQITEQASKRDKHNGAPAVVWHL